MRLEFKFIYMIKKKENIFMTVVLLNNESYDIYFYFNFYYIMFSFGVCIYNCLNQHFSTNEVDTYFKL